MDFPYWRKTSKWKHKKRKIIQWERERHTHTQRGGKEYSGMQREKTNSQCQTTARAALAIAPAAPALAAEPRCDALLLRTATWLLVGNAQWPLLRCRHHHDDDACPSARPPARPHCTVAPVPSVRPSLLRVRSAETIKARIKATALSVRNKIQYVWKYGIHKFET
jgi:hypothetical protein